MRISLWVKDRLRWFFWFPFRRILTWLPLDISYQLGVLLGFGLHLLNKPRREKTKRELLSLSFTRELDNSNIAFITRWSTINLMLNHIDILLYPKLAHTPIAEYTEIHGQMHLDAALSQNRGVILVHTHFGNPQLLMSALGGRNYPINQLGRGLQDIGSAETDVQLDLPELTPMLEQVLNQIHELEQTLPAKFIYIQKTLLPVFRCLKKNEILAMAIDGLGGNNRVPVSVQGRQISFSTGPAAIAKRTGAVLLPTFVIRRKPEYRHQVVIDPPFELIDTGDETADLKVNTQHLADRFAEFLAMYPCQYARLFGYKRPYFIENKK